MKDTKGFGRIYRIAPKNKKLSSPEININSVEGQLLAFKSPAINVRNLGFEKLKQQGESAVPLVKTLLADRNPYIVARSVWLLAHLGEKGKAETEKILNDPDEQLRAVAYKALRQTDADILSYAARMASDTSAYVRREVAISLKGFHLVSFWQKSYLSL